MWTKHKKICLILIVLLMPISILDWVTLGPSGGDFIALNFRGFLILAYLIFLIIHIGLSSLGILFFPRSNLLFIHFCSVLFVVIVCVTGFYIRDKRDAAESEKEFVAHIQKRKPLIHTIELKRWWFVHDKEYPVYFKEIHAEIVVADSGKFSGRADIKEYTGMFASTNTSDRMVKAQEHFIYIIPLKEWKFDSSNVNGLELTFSLHKNIDGKVKEIYKIFKKAFITEDNGTSFYGLLPPASADTTQ